MSPHLPPLLKPKKHESNREPMIPAWCRRFAAEPAANRRRNSSMRRKKIQLLADAGSSGEHLGPTGSVTFPASKNNPQGAPRCEAPPEPSTRLRPTEWITTNLRLKVNATQSGVGRPWERKFLGFRINPRGKIEAAPQSVERFKTKVRELWRSGQSRSSEELREGWCAYLRGWWGYYRLAEERRGLFGLEGWIRRHIRSCFWQRWHNRQGRLRNLRNLGLKGRQLEVAHSSKGAWKIAASPSLQAALSNAVLRRYGFWMPSDLASP